MAATSSVARSWSDSQGELHRFRKELYDCLTAWPDALFELVDAITAPTAVAGVAQLSLAATAMRGHGSGYAAIARGGIETEQLRDVLTAKRPASWRPDFDIDTSTWMRCDAECSPERGYYYHPSRHSAGKPIVAGWCYSWLAALSPGADSWTAPADVVRMPVAANPNTVAVHQIRALLQRWIDEAVAVTIPELRSFANGLYRDFDAVRNGLTLPWSSGPVEGNVNRVKMIKRQMFGRAKLELLRKRVLATP